MIVENPLAELEARLDRQLKYELEHYSHDHNYLKGIIGPLGVMLAQVKMALAVGE